MGWNHYPLPNVNGATVEVCKWMNNFTPHITGHVITYPSADCFLFPVPVYTILGVDIGYRADVKTFTFPLTDESVSTYYSYIIWASSPAKWLFIQLLVKINNKELNKFRLSCFLEWESIDDLYISLTHESKASPWASYQIRNIAGSACAGNAGNVFPRYRIQRKPLVSDPGMHHGTCVTHVPWCMSGSLTRACGENVPGIPGPCAPTLLRIWQEAHIMTSAWSC